MTKQFLYTYLGDNGIITTPIHLEGISCIKKCRLFADENKSLTKDNETFLSVVITSLEDINNWKEVDLVKNE